MQDIEKAKMKMHEEEVEKRKMEVERSDGEKEEEDDDEESLKSSSDQDAAQSGDEEEDDASEDEEDDEDDDPLAMLTPEQRKIIEERQAKLKKGFQAYREKEQSEKIRDLMTATGVFEEEAKIALECCNNDEMEAANRITTEPEFLDTLKEILFEQRAEREKASKIFANEELDENTEKQKIQILEKRKKSEAAIKKLRSSKKQSVRDNSRRPDAGYKLDGTKRAENIRLKDALAKLDEIRTKKLQALRVKKVGKDQSDSLSVTSASLSCKNPLGDGDQEDIVNKSPDAESATADGKSGGSRSPESSSKQDDGSEPADTSNLVLEESDDDDSDDDFVSGPKRGKSDFAPMDVSQVDVNGENVKCNANVEVPSVEKEPRSRKVHSEEVEADDVEYTEEDLKALKWSDARIRAFLGRKSNPNAYYYRFNAPGEEQETGEWSLANHKRFMELIKDGVDYRWGIFSMRIPGRVGYQCSNYYRKLILDGKVHDPNYNIDHDGKLKFVRPKGLKRGGAESPAVFNPVVSGGGSKTALIKKLAAAKTASETSPMRPKARPKPKQKKKRSNGDYVYADEIDSSDGESDTGEYGYGCARTSKRQRLGNVEKKKVSNEPQLIPGLKCPMTLEPVHDPAISPYGHIMGYDTWLRVLGRKPKNTCPFTKQKLTRRMLVKLSKENLKEYQAQVEKILKESSSSSG